MNILVNFLAVLICKAGEWIIIVVAVINVGLFICTTKEIKKVDDICNPRNDIANGVRNGMQLSGDKITELDKERKKLVTLYTLYANITAIFPLLGILGTVAALVTYSDETMMESFMVALGTTLLGVFCAIISKGFDAMLSGPMDVIIGNADHIIQKHRGKEVSE